MARVQIAPTEEDKRLLQDTISAVQQAELTSKISIATLAIVLELRPKKIKPILEGSQFPGKSRPVVTFYCNKIKAFSEVLIAFKAGWTPAQQDIAPKDEPKKDTSFEAMKDALAEHSDSIAAGGSMIPSSAPAGSVDTLLTKLVKHVEWHAAYPYETNEERLRVFANDVLACGTLLDTEAACKASRPILLHAVQTLESQFGSLVPPGSNATDAEKRVFRRVVNFMGYVRGQIGHWLHDDAFVARGVNSMFSTLEAPASFDEGFHRNIMRIMDLAVLNDVSDWKRWAKEILKIAKKHNDSVFSQSYEALAKPRRADGGMVASLIPNLQKAWSDAKLMGVVDQLSKQPGSCESGVI